MNVLIIKLGATGDVVRTSTLLRRLEGDITWITAEKNTVLLQGLEREVRCFSWENRQRAAERPYDLVINLEDELEMSSFLRGVKYVRVFGAYLDDKNQVRYTEDSQGWFDLSLISVHGRKEADQWKLRNRSTYQDLVFQGLGL